MSHEFETGFSVEKQMWHGLGNVVELEDVSSVDKALEVAGLDWLVTTAPVYCEVMTSAGVSMVAIAKRRGVYRERKDSEGNLLKVEPSDVFDVVTERYQPYQNREALTAFQPLLDDGTLRLETAGSLQGGRKVWLLARYAADVEVKEGDALVPYVLLAMGHDGKLSVRMLNTPVRVVCWNTMQAAGVSDDGDGVRGPAVSGGFAIPHVGDVGQKVLEARDYIVACNRELGLTVQAYRKLAETDVTSEQVRRFTKNVFDEDYVKAQKLIARLREREELEAADIKASIRGKIQEIEDLINKPSRVERKVVELLETGPGSELAGKTAWGAFNAATRYIDHERGNNADTRLTQSWFGQGATLRRKAFSEAAALLR